MCEWDQTQLTCSHAACHQQGPRSFCLCHGRPWCVPHRQQCEQRHASRLQIQRSNTPQPD